MIATTSYITSRFNYFNDLIFGGKLKSIELRVNNTKSAGGQFNYYRNCRARYIAISKKFDFTPEELDDVLVHEMIHYWDFTKRGTSDHGTQFQKKMNEINKKFGMNITIQGKWEINKETFHRWICVGETYFGQKIIIPVVSDNAKMKMEKYISCLNIKNYTWFKTNDTFFAKFKTITTRRPGYFYANEETIKHCA